MSNLLTTVTNRLCPRCGYPMAKRYLNRYIGPHAWQWVCACGYKEFGGADAVMEKPKKEDARQGGLSNTDIGVH
jgi:ribosomal protein S27AE